jgi:hypothetical protein
MVRVYTSQQELVAIHDRAQPGERRTQPEHLPPEKVGQGTLSRATCRARAAAMGPATLAVVEDLLAQRPVDKMRVAGRVLELANRYGTARVEAACRIALDHGEPDYQTVKTILQGNLDQPQSAPPPPTTGLLRFARAACEYVVAMAGGAP